MTNGRISRRQLLRATAVASAATAATPPPAPAQPADDYRNYFGDLHCHNHIGYAQGSLRRSFEIGRNHLDFMAFTPHAYWPDIETYPGQIENKWINGFAVAEARWPEVVELAREFDDPGQFTTILGYERHSTYEGDYHILYPDLEGDYELIDDLRELQAFAKQRGCIMVPHHPSNQLGHRGTDPTLIDPAVSPVLEMYSEWGCAEHDRAPYPYKRHTEGGRWTKQTLQHFLESGYRLGVIASTDDHLGFPGGYREGLAVVKTRELSRDAIFEALRARRSYAVTGDRIDLDFRLNGALMGQELGPAAERRIEVAVDGWDQLDRVEVVKNGRVIHRDFPMDREPGRARWDEPVVLRFEYGWGPWPALGWNRTADWEIDIRVEGGTIEAYQPCFCPGPLDEGRRDRFTETTKKRLRLTSFTSLKQQVEDFSQKAVVLKIKGDAETKITVALTQPTRTSLTKTLGELAESNEMLFTAPFPMESAMLHRLVFADNHRTRFSFTDRGDSARDDWYYARVTQANEQLAWSSPIWVKKSN